jgi:protein PhnA
MFATFDIHTLLRKNIMTSSIPPCAKCGMPNTYPDRELFICADCGYEWHSKSSEDVDDTNDLVIKDANGTILKDGDSVVLIKDLKVKGSSTTLKVGTKIKSIRIVGGDHEVDCKTDLGQFMLKACFLRKS